MKSRALIFGVVGLLSLVGCGGGDSSTSASSSSGISISSRPALGCFSDGAKVEAYNTAGRSDLAEIEAAELVVLEKYLPKALSAEEVEALINAAVAEAKAQGLEGMKAMGAVMKVLTPQVNGRADGGAVAAAVKKALGA